MQPLRVIESKAVSLPLDDLDTDIIYPARFLLVTRRDDLGRHVFLLRSGRLAGPVAQRKEEGREVEVAVAGLDGLLHEAAELAGDR